MLFYIHGFNSSAASFKAQRIRARMAELGRESEFVCPDLPDRPREAITLLEGLIDPADRVCMIGSSLGGFYATWLAEKHDLCAVLVNPAVRPYELLRDCIGRQKNLYTGVEYDFTEAHIENLRALEVGRITVRRYLLITRTGDEVLDYRAAVAKYRGCEQLVIGGGDHGFGDFEDYLAWALGFCASC